MKIKGTEWYTAYRISQLEGSSFCMPCGSNMTLVKGSERGMEQMFFGYRMPVHEKDSAEVKELMAILKSSGVNTKLRTSKRGHTGIPAGTPFLEVFDEESTIALEKIFLNRGVVLSPNRYKEYGLEHINRPPQSAVQHSLLSKRFERK